MTLKATRPLFTTLLALLLVAVVGCGDAKQIPVEGKVTLGTDAMKTGNVTLIPDKGKGNTKVFAAPPIGTIDASGNYSISTGGKPGAPAGWYKVTVQASVPSDPKNEYSVPRSLINEAYGDESKTSLSYEVKANASPGSYDLKLTK